MDTRRHRLGMALLALVSVCLLAATVSGPALARTAILKDIPPGPRSSNPWSLTRAGGMVFFTTWSGQTRLWRTQGSRSSTIVLKRYKEGLGDLRSVEGKFIYWTEDCWRGWPCDPWTSDGTRKGTGIRDRTIKDRVATGAFARLGRAYLYPSRERRVRQRTLMRSDDGWVGSGIEIYRFEGGVGALTRVGGAVYFYADDGMHGRELWRTDGTVAGTRLVKDILSGAVGSNPDELTAVEGKLYFIASAPDAGRGLWVSDGTEAGTRPVLDPSALQLTGVSYLTRVGDRLFFLADDGKHGKEPWVSDGTPNGTRLLRDIRQGPQASKANSLTAVAGRLYFTADDGRRGRELWVSDGTRRGTRLVKDIKRGPKGSMPTFLTRLGRKLIFIAENRRHGRELWVHTR